MTAIRSANQLEGFDQPLRMVEMTVRQHQGLDPPEIEVHVPAIALQSIRVRARIEEHGAGFTVPMRRDRQAQPMVGRTERLAGEFGHPRGHEDAQLGGDVLGTTGQHICDVIHHNVDGQLVYWLHMSQPFMMIKGNPDRRGPGRIRQWYPTLRGVCAPNAHRRILIPERPGGTRRSKSEVEYGYRRSGSIPLWRHRV